MKIWGVVGIEGKHYPVIEKEPTLIFKMDPCIAMQENSEPSWGGGEGFT